MDQHFWAADNLLLLAAPNIEVIRPSIHLMFRWVNLGPLSLKPNWMLPRVQKCWSICYADLVYLSVCFMNFAFLCLQTKPVCVHNIISLRHVGKNGFTFGTRVCHINRTACIDAIYRIVLKLFLLTLLALRRF